MASTGFRRNSYRMLVGKSEGKGPPGGHKRRWEDIMNFKRNRWEGLEWINLAEKDKWRGLESMVMDLGCTLLHQVGEFGRQPALFPTQTSFPLPTVLPSFGLSVMALPQIEPRSSRRCPAPGTSRVLCVVALGLRYALRFIARRLSNYARQSKCHSRRTGHCTHH